MTRHGRRGYMKLGAFFHPTGNHVAAWLHPDAQVDAGTNVEHYIALAQTAERGKFDLMFLADAVATRDGNLAALSRWPQYMAYFEPLTLLASIASVTKRIGLVSTATTSYNEPSTGAENPTADAALNCECQLNRREQLYAAVIGRSSLAKNDSAVSALASALCGRGRSHPSRSG